MKKWNYCLSLTTIKIKSYFFGNNGFEISSHVETYKDIAEFIKCIIENDIGIPKLRHREVEEKTELISLLLDCINNSNSKNYYIKKSGEPYKGKIVLNCGTITDEFGNELVFIWFQSQRWRV